MKKKHLRKLMAAFAAASGLLAGSINGYAQSTSSSGISTDKRDTGTGSAGSVAPTSPTPTAPSTRPAPTSPDAAPVAPPANGTIVPILLPAPNTDSTAPTLPPAGTTGSDGRSVLPPAGGTGSSGSVQPVPPSGTIPRDVKPANVTLVGTPAMPLLSGQPVPVSPASGKGVVVFAGDIVRTPAPTETSPTTVPGNASPVIALVQQFDVQRTQELSSRAAQLEQLRMATPDQRATIIAELQVAAKQQAAEQREAARELRSEMRALREERKGN